MMKEQGKNGLSPADRARQKALKRLGARDYSAREMTEWLVRGGTDPETAAAVVAELRASGAVDDVRYAQMAFRVCFGKNWSRRRAFRQLAEKGVSGADAEAAFVLYEEEEGRVDETALARREMEKVLRMADLTASDPVPEKIRGRVARRLAGRGFSHAVIYDLLGELRRPELEFED